VAKTVELNIPEDSSNDPTEEMSVVSDASSTDPTEKEMKAISLSTPVIEPHARPAATTKANLPYLLIAAAIAIVVVASAFLLAR
jgi:hypothetical protein